MRGYVLALAMPLVFGLMASTLSDRADATPPGALALAPHTTMSLAITPVTGVKHNGQHCFAKRVRTCLKWQYVGDYLRGKKVCRIYGLGHETKFFGCHAYH